MLDKLDKALDLLAAMKAAVPFEAELTPPLIARLRTGRDGVALAPRQFVRDVSSAGDEGGILCHIEPDDGGKSLIVSLTHLAIRRYLPFANDALDYR